MQLYMLWRSVCSGNIWMYIVLILSVPVMIMYLHKFPWACRVICIRKNFNFPRLCVLIIFGDSCSLLRICSSPQPGQPRRHVEELRRKHIIIVIFKLVLTSQINLVDSYSGWATYQRYRCCDSPNLLATIRHQIQVRWCPTGQMSTDKQL